MATSLNPYLGFAGEARSAFEFYQRVFGGDLEVSTYREGGMEATHPDYLMHADLRTPDGFRIMGADMHDEVTPGHGITVNGDSAAADRIRQIWAGLSEGAEITFPLGTAPWGGEFGQLVDRFGIAWLLAIEDSFA
ncbi:VOC family protein [Rarobacter faecitabidus]|uniref:PhnB protein n=1 Tax=Rarobacter faecitabidus TaxID=13243 RepID=A0A542ZXC7_RARFA|nr:VOC family protein [Rarobacter faecitabidus]TQL65007.1 PhnB protein [Rarobacter faecitabidus]